MAARRAWQAVATAATVGLVLAGVIGAQQVPRAVGPFTTEQAKAGQIAYQRYCGRCHGPDLAGRDNGPALVGADFIEHWRRRTALELFQYIQKTMPPESSGDAGFKVDLSIVAFMLEANGAKAGTVPLSMTTEVAIGTVADGRMPPAVRAALSNRR